MALTTTVYNAGAVAQRAQGSFSGTYTAADQTFDLGFQVKYFRIINVTDGLVQEWWDGMNLGDYLETVRTDAGTTSHNTLETDNSIEVNSGGVPGRIFIDISVANIITDNDLVVWEAYG